MMPMRYLILSAFVVFWLILPVWAQESPTEESTPESVIEPSAIITFPEMIYFEAVISLPAEEVARVLLTIQVPGSDPIVVDFPQQKPFDFASEYVVASYEWELTPDNAPHLFSDVSYSWRVVSPRERVYERTQTVEFTDHRTRWQQVDVIEDAVNITYPMNTTVNARALERDTAAAYEKLQTNTGSAPALKFLLFPESLPPGCDITKEGLNVVTRTLRDGTVMEIPCDVALAEAIYSASDYNVFSLHPGQDIQNELIQTMIQAFYTPIWSQTDTPAWFRDGIRQLYLRNADNSALSISRIALRNDRQFTLTEMLTPPEDPDLLAIWRAQSYGMVVYIAAKNGVDTLVQLAREPNAAPTFAETYTQLTGKSLDVLIADWQTWLYTHQAEAAYTYSIYLATTPTPTMTFTPTITRTKLPPTETPSLTPDYTPTHTPTRIPRLKTPTVTPLPPQSFSLRPTAAPTPQTTQATSPIAGVSITQLGVLGLMGLLVIIIAYLGFGRRTR
jgi:hypothetical protein